MGEQKRETSSQSEGSELIEGVLWVDSHWENGERKNILMRDHGFRDFIFQFAYYSPNPYQNFSSIQF